MSRVELPPLPPGVAAFTPTQRDHIALEALMRRYGIACAKAALEAAANAVPTTRSSVSLLAGEMTAQEWRTASALLRHVQDAIKSLLRGLQ
jgi:hypothetical protein